MLRVLLAEHVDALREALAAFVAEAPEAADVGEARDGAELLHIACHWPGWDVILVDRGLACSHGRELLRRLTQTCPGAPVLMLISEGDATTVQMYLQAGAAGCLDPGVAFDELWPAIRQVRQGNAFVSPSLIEAGTADSAEALAARVA